MKHNLDPSIMQTKTMGKVVTTLKRVRSQLRVKDNRELRDEVNHIIKMYEKNMGRMKNNKKDDVSYSKSTGIYTVNL